MLRTLVCAILCGVASVSAGDVVTVQETEITEWKAVFGQIETRVRVPARARLGGTIIRLGVTEGDTVTAGQQLALVEDQKLAFRLAAIDAQHDALTAQLETARADLTRGQTLIERGIITTQRFDQLGTAVDVLTGQITSLDAERRVIEQQVAEGAVLAPATGVALLVPVSQGSVIVPGEVVAVIGGDGVYLRLTIPERHAANLAQGDVIEIGTSATGARQTGRLVKLYPQIEGGRIQADVEVDDLDDRFVGRRVPVRLPVGTRAAILVPADAVTRSGGLDIVTVQDAAGDRIKRPVVVGAPLTRDGQTWREVLSGLAFGEQVVTGHE
jgi:RND family efflux transporter MFP subunit